MSQAREKDARWMQEALEWSRRGRGWTSPRPSVGCVLVRDGRIIGAGHTQPGHGNPHAEVAALRQAAEAGEDTRGATAYVTLEPCCHFATTPPCTDALIKAGISRAVCGVLDPNPAVNGLGYQKLRDAGIEVVPGFMVDECRKAQIEFLKHITTRTPFVTLKSAVSLDGKVALSNGESKWITGVAARKRAHVLRHEHDAVLVGIGTVLSDDPSLTVRLEGEWKQPKRIVLDSMGRMPLEAKMLRDVASQPVYVVTTEAMPLAHQQALEERGVEVWRLEACDGRIDWQALCRELYAREICSILIEGGPIIAGSALRSGIIDRVVYFIAPLLIGSGREAVEGMEVERLSDAQRLLDVEIERLDDDVMLTGYLRQIP